MQIGMVGLGRMGGNMAARLRQGGHEVVGYDPKSAATNVGSLVELTERLPAPRAVWLMVPAGEATESTIVELAGLLGPDDIVVDGGNSNFRDSVRRAGELAERGIRLVDAGVSGGVWGLTVGYGLMVGGAAEDVARLQPVFDTLRPADGGFVHAGAVGAGHYTKMVHNGIEYGLMQAYAEGYELLDACEFDIDLPKVVRAWQSGTVIRSWLLDLMAGALEADPGLTQVRGYAEDSGEGRWTVDEAVRLAVPLPVITAALFARFASRQPDSPAMKVVASLRNQFGGHAVLPQSGATAGDTASGTSAGG